MNSSNSKSIMSKKILATFFGVCLTSVSIGLFLKTAAYGVDPFQSFMTGLDKFIPIQFGTLSMITYAILLIFSFIFDKHYIGLGTLINLFISGYIIQYSYAFMQQIFPDPSIGLRIFFFLLGILGMCFSTSFYFTADLGVSPYDAISLILANKWHLAKFQHCRVICDVICVICGCVLYLMGGGKLSMIPTFAGVGTVIIAFFMGPLVNFFSEKAAKPFLS